MEASGSAPRPHIPYTIVSRVPRPALTPDGRFQKVYTVTFTGPGGVSDYIDVPETDYNAATLDALIEARLDEHEAVRMLGPQPHPANAA